MGLERRRVDEAREERQAENVAAHAEVEAAKAEVEVERQGVLRERERLSRDKASATAAVARGRRRESRWMALQLACRSVTIPHAPVSGGTEDCGSDGDS